LSTAFVQQLSAKQWNRSKNDWFSVITPMSRQIKASIQQNASKQLATLNYTMNMSMDMTLI